MVHDLRDDGVLGNACSCANDGNGLESLASGSIGHEGEVRCRLESTLALPVDG